MERQEEPEAPESPDMDNIRKRAKLSNPEETLEPEENLEEQQDVDSDIGSSTPLSRYTLYL